MLKFNKSTLEQLEKMVSLAQYRLRYERGVFQSDHCVLHDKRIIVINKFIPLEARINVLIDFVQQFRDEFVGLPLETPQQKILQDCLGTLELKS